MTASEVLRRARALIEKPERWHVPDEERARMFAECERAIDEQLRKDGLTAGFAIITLPNLHERLIKVLRIDNHQLTTPAERQPYEKAAKYLAESTGEPTDRDLYALNERMTHASLIAVLDRAIAAAEARGE